MILDDRQKKMGFDLSELVIAIQSATSNTQGSPLDATLTQNIAQTVLDLFYSKIVVSEYSGDQAPLVLTDDDVRILLQKRMAAAGGLVKWAKANELPISRVSEFNTGRRPASLAILVALGLTRAIVPLNSGSSATHT
ncbi:hypothetical protein [Sphingomonas lacusdianchii]|uniref:hypothetical protein n=1 Tax=Sphingomonas lacusdianchii TaxID=2917992 RepID=UPI001F58D004|nr:hypothetical protein [Sphingomonas sp. JXJ CY 53]